MLERIQDINLKEYRLLAGLPCVESVAASDTPEGREYLQTELEKAPPEATHWGFAMLDGEIRRFNCKPGDQRWVSIYFCKKI
jgi:hypothetical protein